MVAVTECFADFGHDVVCVDVRPVLNGPDFEQPVNDSSQESMDAVAELLTVTTCGELTFAMARASRRKRSVMSFSAATLSCSTSRRSSPTFFGPFGARRTTSPFSCTKLCGTPCSRAIAVYWGWSRRAWRAGGSARRPVARAAVSRRDVPRGTLAYKTLFAVGFTLFILSLLVNVGMWLERFIIIVTSLHRDFLPSSWDMYAPTRWDFGMFAGTIGLFLALFFLFIRFLPAIAIFEMRTIVPEAKLKAEHHG